MTHRLTEPFKRIGMCEAAGIAAGMVAAERLPPVWKPAAPIIGYGVDKMCKAFDPSGFKVSPEEQRRALSKVRFINIRAYPGVRY